MRSPRALPLALLAVVPLLTASACSSSSEAKPDASPAGEVTDKLEPLPDKPKPKLPVTVTSATGEDVKVTDVDRLVPLTGSLSEIVFTLGLGDKVVARDITATFEQAEDLPVVTRGHDVSAENVLSLKPSLVLAAESTGPDEAMDQIAAAGIPVLVFEPVTGIDGIGDHIRDVAGALGVPEAGEQLSDRTDERIDAVAAEVPKPEKPLRVAFLYLRGSASVYLIGGAESGASGLIEAVGAVDAGKESGIDKDFTPITSEALVAAAPDVILVMTKGLESVGGVEGLVEIPGIAQTPAGMDKRVASIDDGVLLNFGPRTDQVLASLAKQIHGD